MAKIDVTKIENYSTMTPEQKLAALEAFEYEDGNGGELERYKAAVTKANSEAADWKKKHNALLSEEERKEAERLENGKKLEEELASLRKDKAISESKAKYLGLGYDEKLASSTAEAFANGDMNTVFANMAIHQENHDKALKAQMLNNTPTPGAGNPGNVDYTKKIEEAQTAGDISQVAYYTRLSQQSQPQ